MAARCAVARSDSLTVRDIPEIGCEKRWLARSPGHRNGELDGNFCPVCAERGHLDPPSDHGRLACFQIPSQPRLDDCPANAAE